MTFAEFWQNVIRHTGATALNPEPPYAYGTLPQNEYDSIRLLLMALYDNPNAIAARETMDAAVFTGTIEIAKAVDPDGAGGPAWAYGPNIIGVNLDSLNTYVYMINDHGTLIRHDADLVLIHELSHLDQGQNLYDPAVDEASLNVPNADVKGTAVMQENLVASQTGRADQVRASYQAAGKLDAFPDIILGMSYSRGQQIDNARIGGFDENGAPIDDYINHYWTTDQDKLRDLIIAGEGNDQTMKGQHTYPPPAPIRPPDRILRITRRASPSPHLPATRGTAARSRSSQAGEASPAPPA